MPWIENLLQRLTNQELFQVRGITTVVANPKQLVATSAAIERLDEALGLIETYQPWRLAHLRRDLRQISVMRYACRGAYFPEERACMVELTFLGRRDIGAETVASTIIHEGMHARVHAFGRWLSAIGERNSQEPIAKNRAREERLCRTAELEFGQALPPDIGAPVIERALGSLALADDDVAPEIDWAEAQRRIDEVDSR